jgi:tRNA threonylcarbamoyladenosine biosynthesis protein TsaB
MIVLGFDTATPSTAVALRLTDGRTLKARDDPGSGEHPGHATRLLSMTGELLARAGVPWRAIDRLAVGVGPGTFTGLRVGIATARGLAQSLSVELVGVSSLEALAVAAMEQGGYERVLAVIDARRGEAFAAAYRAIERASIDEPASPRELASPRALAPEELGGVVAQAEQGEREHGERWVAVGNGATRFRGHLELAGVEVPAEGSPLHVLDAQAICDIGVRSPAVDSYEDLVPDYRRRPDAEITLDGVVASGASGP